MRFPLFLACASLLAVAMATAGAAEGSIWVEGRWENTGGQYQWRQGYWQTTTTTVYANAPAPAAPATTWVEGRWAQGANGWVWVEGHYEQAPQAPVATGPTYPPPQQQPQQVVVVEQPRPATTVVVGAGYGYVGYNNGYSSVGYGYNNGYCAPRPVTYCPPARPVVYCPPRPVVHCPPARPVVHCPPPAVYCPPVRVQLPRPSIAFVEVGKHKLPVPVPVFRRR